MAQLKRVGSKLAIVGGVLTQLCVVLAPGLVLAQPAGAPSDPNVVGQPVVPGQRGATGQPGTTESGQPAPTGGETTAGETVRAPRQEFFIRPGVRLTTRYSNNNTFVGEGNPRVGGFTQEVSPFVTAGYETSRTQATLFYSFRHFTRLYDDPATERSYHRNDLRADANTMLIENFLYVRARALSYTISGSPTGTLTADPAASIANAQPVQAFQLNPYIKGRFGSQADYLVDYLIGRNKSSGFGLNPISYREQRLGTYLSSGPAFGDTWRWRATAIIQQRDFDGDVTLGRKSFNGTLLYAFGPELRIGPSITYDQIDRVFGSNGEDHGFGAGVSAEFTPSRQTSVTGSFVKQYYGNAASLLMAHRGASTSFGLRYSQAIISSTDPTIFVLDQSSLFSPGGFAQNSPAVINTLLGNNYLSLFPGLTSTGTISDAALKDRTLSASATYNSARSQYLIALYASERKSLIDVLLLAGGVASIQNTDLKRRGAILGWNLRWSPTTEILTALRTENNQTNSGAQFARFYAFTSGFTSRLSSTVSAGVALRYSVQRGDTVSAAAYNEVLGLGFLEVRF